VFVTEITNGRYSSQLYLLVIRR